MFSPPTWIVKVNSLNGEVAFGFGGVLCTELKFTVAVLTPCEAIYCFNACSKLPSCCVVTPAFMSELLLKLIPDTAACVEAVGLVSRGPLEG